MCCGEQFLEFGPADVVVVEPDREPSSVSVMRRPREPGVLKKCFAFCRVTQEVDRASGGRPPCSRWRRGAVEDGESSATDVEEARVSFERLALSTAQRMLKFWKDRAQI